MPGSQKPDSTVAGSSKRLVSRHCLDIRAVRKEAGEGSTGSRSGTFLPIGGAARRYVLDFLSTTDGPG